MQYASNFSTDPLSTIKACVCAKNILMRNLKLPILHNKATRIFLLDVNYLLVIVL